MVWVRSSGPRDDDGAVGEGRGVREHAGYTGEVAEGWKVQGRGGGCYGLGDYEGAAAGEDTRQRVGDAVVCGCNGQGTRTI